MIRVLSKRPEPKIKYGLLQPESEKEIMTWVVDNFKNFLPTIGLSKTDLVKHDKEIREFCESLYIEIHDVGYSEGSEASEN